MFSHEQLAEIAEELLLQYALDPRGIHGVGHWGRVLDNGVRLAALTGANQRVVQLFGLFHDSRRLNDDHDPEHGARGAALAAELNARLLGLAPAELALLQDACARHTRGLTQADITVQTCWDADRLDLPRVGMSPAAEKLCTRPARERAFLALACDRSLASYLTPLAANS